MADTVGGLLMPPEAPPNLHAPNDPPVFILLASPAWGPSSWLPDTAYQKIPIGVTGQVLTVQADGSINWQNSASGFANPMTTLGDLIEGGASGLPTRLAIGSSGQVLTVSGGVPAWVNPVTGFANPMTTTGDLIFSNPGSTPVRLGIGTSGQALVVSGGVPSWSSSVLVNPMTTTGDIIIATTGGAATRLPAGVANQVLTMISGSPSWQNSPAGFANPMVALGDIITGATGGSPARLGAGTTGQVLTIVSGAPAWATNPAGFANPMTTPQDLIVGGVAGAAGRLGVGLDNQVLTVVGGAVEWSNPPGVQGIPVAGPSPSQQVVFQQGDGNMLVIPLSTYGVVGGDDGHWINIAYGLLPTEIDVDTGLTETVGQVLLNPAIYNIITGIVKPPMADLIGSGMGTVLSYSGTGSCVSSHYGAVGGLNQNLTKCGLVWNLRIDGTNTTTGTPIGLDMGDGNGHSAQYVWIGNFMLPGSVGLSINNQHFFTEKGSWKKVYVWNCHTAVLVTTTVSDLSMEYNDAELYLRCFASGTGPNTTLYDQRGIVFSGIHWNGSLFIRGNYITPVTNIAGTPPPAVIPAMISLYTPMGGSAASVNGTIDFHMECNGGGTAPYKIYLGDTNVQLGNNGAGGLLRFDGGQDPATPAIGQFAFKGPIDDINALRRVQNPTPPSSGTGYQSTQCDAWVFLSTSGGTITAVTVDGVAYPVVAAATAGPFYVGWNRFITPTYTGTLSWTWANAS